MKQVLDKNVQTILIINLGNRLAYQKFTNSIFDNFLQDYCLKRCWLFWDSTQNMLNFGLTFLLEKWDESSTWLNCSSLAWFRVQRICTDSDTIIDLVAVRIPRLVESYSCFLCLVKCNCRGPNISIFYIMIIIYNKAFIKRHLSRQPIPRRYTKRYINVTRKLKHEQLMKTDK